ncbi:MAG: hypothetical protein JKY19_07870 [Alcanivoracaceae bacterium]|nr:hypothetical protein [Alcanivoracaceae bacterium]
MKDLNNQFAIEKTTIRDLTPSELDLVAGGTIGDPNDPPPPSLTITTLMCTSNNGDVK